MVAVGEYYAKVKIGGQTLRVQIDTGSATLAVPVKECANCKRGDMRYSYHDSNSGIANMVTCDDTLCGPDTCSPYGCGKCSSTKACCASSDHDKCAFHLNFGDGSGAKGILVRDQFQWGDVKFPVTFGGIRSDSPDFERSQVDGILGMAYKSLACNPTCVVPTFDAMRETVSMKDMFSICITYDSGKIVLGDYDPLLSTKPVSWVPLELSSPPSFYSFPLVGNLRVNDHELPLPSYSRAIVDSGTTLIVFSHSTFDKFRRHLQTKYCDVPGLCAHGKESWFRPAHCTKISKKDRAKLPTLKFGVQGFDITLEPDDYLINYASKGPETWCVGIMALDAMSGGVDVILGNTVMKKYVTVYDRENERVGFAESDMNCGFDVKKGAEETLPVPDSDEDEESEGEGQEEQEEGQEQEEGGATEGGMQGGESGEPKHETDGADTKGKANGGNGSAGRICRTARDCNACVQISEANCTWNSSGQCEEGNATLLMCTLDSLAGKLVYVITGAGMAAVLLVLLVVVGVQSYRKRQGASVSGGEEEEVERPLAENEVDTSGAFSLDDDEESGRAQA